MFGGAVCTVVAQPPSDAANRTAAQQNRPVIEIPFNVVCISNPPSTDYQNRVGPWIDRIWLGNVLRLGLRAFFKRAYEPASINVLAPDILHCLRTAFSSLRTAGPSAVPELPLPASPGGGPATLGAASPDAASAPRRR
jgi:hypothetical protein